MSESEVQPRQVEKMEHEPSPPPNPFRLNDLSGREWTSLSASVIDSREVSTPRKKDAQVHGATFPPLLAERIIRMYSKKGDMVLDPFMGTGTTLVAAQKWERRGFGIELYEKFCQMARDRLSQERLVSPPSHTIIQGDCREVLRTMGDNVIQLCFTSPPYANFIRKSLKKNPRTDPSDTLVKNKSLIKPYGDDPKDFGNLEYSPFLGEVGVLMKKLHRVIKPGGYNIWVVKDYRDTKAKIPLIPFHSDLAYVGEKAGFVLTDFLIWNQNFGRKLLILGFPTTFYVNLNHNFLVVLRKPR